MRIMFNNKFVWMTFWLLVIFGIFLAFIAFWYEPRSLVVKEVKIESPHWHGKPIRIALISDIHADNFHMPLSRVKSIVAQTNSLNPDLVFLGGDYAGGHFGESHLPKVKFHNRSREDNQLHRDEIIAFNPLAENTRLGAIAIMGNHDCWWSCDETRKAFSQTKVAFLENRNLHIQQLGWDFWVIGLEDDYSQRPDYRFQFSQIPSGADVLTLAHNPRLFNLPEASMVFSSRSNSPNIQFSGHSHGGQVRFPIIGAPVTSTLYTEETIDGFMIENSRALIVTSGLGETGLPVRFGTPPEIMVIELKHGANAVGSSRRIKLR